LAEAFILGADFIGTDKICLILGDNIFFGSNFEETLKRAAALDRGAIVYGYSVNDPERYGVVEFDSAGKAISIEEKPKIPKSNYAVTGLYFYDNSVVSIAKNVKPSWRGELEITDVNNEYLRRGELKVESLGQGFAWLDTGTFQSFTDAAIFIKTIEERTGVKIGCLEEIAYRQGFIDKEQVKKLAEPLMKSKYGEYLLKVIA
jgi:glucose-1-phosphate thymidylyltransferase